jgi:hypothetical protein
LFADVHQEILTLASLNVKVLSLDHNNYLFTGSIARKIRRARNFSNKYLRTSSVRKLSLLLVEHIWTIDLLVVFVLLRDSAHNCGPLQISFFLQQLINNHDGYDQDVGG